MKTPSIPIIALLNAIGTVIYVFIVSQIMRNGGYIFGKIDHTFFAPMVILLLFVISAAITGSLVVGRPILWFLDGRKTDAVKLFLYTIGWLVIITLIIFTVLILK